MLLIVENLRKTFPGAEAPLVVLNGVGLSLDAGETLALQGESGSGKSTLLHLIGALDAADSGTIRLAGREITALDEAGRAALRRTEVGLIFQKFNLIPSLNVADNIAFQARLGGRHDPGRTTALATALGLTAQLGKYPEALSGGQQQRVAIARTLAARPRIILADEPTGSLDEATAAAVMDEMLALVAETGAALIVATHSPLVAARLDRQVYLHRGRLA